MADGDVNRSDKCGSLDMGARVDSKSAAPAMHLEHNGSGSEDRQPSPLPRSRIRSPSVRPNSSVPAVAPRRRSSSVRSGSNFPVAPARVSRIPILDVKSDGQSSHASDPKEIAAEAGTEEGTSADGRVHERAGATKEADRDEEHPLPGGTDSNSCMPHVIVRVRPRAQGEGMASRYSSGTGGDVGNKRASTGTDGAASSSKATPLRGSSTSPVPPATAARRNSKPAPPPKDKARLSTLVSESTNSRTTTGSPFAARKAQLAQSAKSGEAVHCHGLPTSPSSLRDGAGTRAGPSPTQNAPAAPASRQRTNSGSMPRQRTGSGSVPRRKAPVIAPKSRPPASEASSSASSDTASSDTATAESSSTRAPRPISSGSPRVARKSEQTKAAQNSIVAAASSKLRTPNTSPSKAPKVAAKRKPTVSSKSSPSKIPGVESSGRVSTASLSNDGLSPPVKPVAHSKPTSPVQQRKSLMHGSDGDGDADERPAWRLSLPHSPMDRHSSVGARPVSPVVARKVALMGLDANLPMEFPVSPSTVKRPLSPLSSPTTIEPVSVNVLARGDPVATITASGGASAVPPPLPPKKRTQGSRPAPIAISSHASTVTSAPAVQSPKLMRSSSPGPLRSPKPMRTAPGPPRSPKPTRNSFPVLLPEQEAQPLASTTDDVIKRVAPWSPAQVQRSRTMLVRSESPSRSPRSQSPVPCPRTTSPVPRKRTRTSVISSRTAEESSGSGGDSDMSRPDSTSPLPPLSVSLPTASVLQQLHATSLDTSDSARGVGVDTSTHPRTMSGAGHRAGASSVQNVSNVVSGDETQVLASLHSIAASQPEAETATATTATTATTETAMAGAVSKPASAEAEPESRSRSPSRRSFKRRAPTPPANVKPYSPERDKPASGSGSPRSRAFARSHSTPPASPLARRASVSHDERTKPSTTSSVAFLSTSAPAGKEGAFLDGADNLLSEGEDFMLNIDDRPTQSSSTPIGEGSDNVVTVAKVTTRRGAPAPPRSIKSPPPIAESPEDLADMTVNTLYSSMDNSTAGSEENSDCGDRDEDNATVMAAPRKRAPAPVLVRGSSQQAKHAVNPYAVANTQPTSLSMPSSPLLSKSPSPDIPAPASPQPQPRVRKLPVPTVRKSASESDLQEAPSLPERNTVSVKPDVGLLSAGSLAEESYGAKEVATLRMESPVYASIPDLVDMRTKGKRDEDLPSEDDDSDMRSESCSPDVDVEAPKLPHLTEEEQRHLEEQMKTLDEELMVEKKTQRSLQQMMKLLEGDKTLEVAEKIDKNEATIAELEKELAKLKEIASGDRKIDNEQRMRLRGQVINELVSTERDFAADMKVCIVGFLKPMQEEGAVDTKMIFGNIEDLLDVAQRFLKLLESRTSVESGEEAQIAGCFTEMRDELSQVYAQYCRNHDDASELMMKLDGSAEHQERMAQLSEDVRNIHNAKAWDLQSFLIKPVQRVLKYPLLLRELAKYTDFSHPDKKELKQAMENMEGVAREINEFKRRKDLMLKYRKSTEEAAKVGMGKLNWHSVTKKTSRLTQKIGQATGFTSSTIDKKFHDEEVLFRELEKATKQLLKNVQEHVQFTEELNTVAQKLLASCQSLYGESTDNTFGVYLQARNYQISGTFGSFMDGVKTSVVDRLEALLSQFENPRFFIDKRNDKLLDFDSCKNRVDKYKLDPDKLKEFKEELKGKQREYEAMNAQLLEDFPKLITVSLKILLRIVASWENLQQIYSASCYQVFTDLDSLEMIPSGAQSTEIVLHKHTQTLLNLYDKWKDFKIIPRGWIERSLSSPTNKGSVRASRSMASLSGSMEALNLTVSRYSSADSVGSGSVSNLSMDSNFSLDLKATTRKRPAIPAYMRQTTSSSQASVLSDFDAENDSELSVTRGMVVDVIAKCDESSNSDWWKIRHGGKSGFVPSSYLSDSGVSDLESLSRVSSASSIFSTSSIAEKPQHPPPLLPKTSREDTKPASRKSSQEGPEYADAFHAKKSSVPKAAVGLVNPYHAVSVVLQDSDTSQLCSRAVAGLINAPTMSPEPPGSTTATSDAISNAATSTGATNSSSSSSSSSSNAFRSTKLSGTASASSLVSEAAEYRVAYDFNAESVTEITLRAGQLVKVLQDHDTTGNSDWWLVTSSTSHHGDVCPRGYIPAAYLEHVDQE